MPPKHEIRFLHSMDAARFSLQQLLRRFDRPFRDRLAETGTPHRIPEGFPGRVSLRVAPVHKCFGLAQVVVRIEQFRERALADVLGNLRIVSEYLAKAASLFHRAL